MGIDGGLTSEDAVPLLVDLSDVILHVPSLAGPAGEAISELILQRFRGQVLCYTDVRLDSRSATTPLLHSRRPARYAVSPRIADMLCDHPLVAYYASTGVDEPLLVRDVCSPAEWESTEIATELRRQFGVRDQVTIPTVVAPTRVCAWVVMRDEPFQECAREAARELRTVLRDLRSPAAAAVGSETAAPRLTPREADVLRLLGDGLTHAAIAHRLAIAPATVDKHLQHIYRKFAVRDRLAAVLAATRCGLLPAPASSVVHGLLGPTGTSRAVPSPGVPNRRQDTASTHR